MNACSCRTSVCDDYLNINPSQKDVFTATTLADMVITVLESGGVEQNQEDLLNLLGETGIELVFQIVQHRDALMNMSDDHLSRELASSQHAIDDHLSRELASSQHATTHFREGINQKESTPSQRPIDDLGLDETYLKQLKQQGLRIPKEPQGWKSQYKGYMSGIKLDHSITTDERIGGRKKYHDVGFSTLDRLCRDMKS